MQRLCAALEALIAAASAACVGAFTLIILADVVCRYWLKFPLTWAAEATVFLFQMTCFAGATVALRRGMHFGLGLLVHDLWPRAARVLKPLCALLVVVASLLVVRLAIQMAEKAWNAKYVTLPMTQAVVYVVLAASAAVLALFALETLVSGRAAKPEGLGE